MCIILGCPITQNCRRGLVRLLNHISVSGTADLRLILFVKGGYLFSYKPVTDLQNLHGNLHILVMLWSADGWGGGGGPGHAMLHVLQPRNLPLLPLALLLLLQLVTHQLEKHDGWV